MIISSVNGRQLTIISGLKNLNGTIIALVCTDKAEIFRIRVYADGRAECVHPMRHTSQCWHVKAVLKVAAHFTEDGLVEHPVEQVRGNLTQPRKAVSVSSVATSCERNLAACGLMR